MAVTDAKDLTARTPLFRLPARVQGWLGSERFLSQRSAGMAFASRAAGAAIVLVSQILFARWMGAREFSLYVYAWTWLVLFADVIHLGLPMTAQRFIPEYQQSGALDRLRGFLRGSQWIVFGAGTTFALAGAGLIYWLTPHLNRDDIVPLYLACVVLPLATMTTISDMIARSYNWTGLGFMTSLVLRPILMLAILAIVHVLGIRIDAVVAMIALFGSIVVASLLQFVVLNRRLSKAVPPGPRQYDIKAWLSIAFPIFTVWGFYTLLCYADVLVLRQFRPEEVGHYYAAAKTLLAVSFVHFAVSAVIAHRFTALQARGDREGLTALVSSTINWIFWPSLALVAVMLAIGKPMLWLFGPDFVDAYPVMFVLAVGLMARAAVGPAERLLNMLGQQWPCALVYAYAFAIAFAGCIVLAPRYGGMGVAAAVSAAIVVESVLLFLVARRRLGLHLFIVRPRFSR